MVDQQSLYDELRKEPDLDEEEKVELRALLDHRPFRALLSRVITERDGKAQSLIGEDLLSDQGRAQAMVVQGQIRGFDRVLDCVIEAVEEGETDGGQ